MAERINKARYWWAVLYPENMISDWESQIDDVLQIPYAYCAHTADVDVKSEHRKDHLHLIIAFANTTTYSHALSVFKLLGDKAVNTCKAIINIRHAYDYLIHDTDACRKAGKHLYMPDERILGNHFDIGAYEQIGLEEKQAMLKELVGFIVAENFMNLVDFTVAALRDFGDEYWEIIVAYNGSLERYCRANYLKWEQRQKSEKLAISCWSRGAEHHEKTCPDCGSREIKKRGKTASDQRRYQCKECGKTFV